MLAGLNAATAACCTGVGAARKMFWARRSIGSISHRHRPTNAPPGHTGNISRNC